MAHDGMKILVEYDGSKDADSVLEDLQNAGLPGEASAKIVSIIEPIIMAGMPEAALIGTCAKVTEYEIRQSRIAIKEACDRLHEVLPDWEMDYASYLGNTEEEIIELARAWNPDLVVIKPSNHGEFSRLIFGSPSRSIVEKSSCSVRIARPAEKLERAGLRLLIGFDGSAAAVREVASRCWQSGTQVRLVAGFKTPGILRPELFDPDSLEKMVGLLRAAGLEASSVLREGKLKQVVLNEAMKFGADCIFLGNDERGELSRLFMSSTTTAIALRANCTVEVVREKAKRLMATDARAGLKAAKRSLNEAIT